MNTFKRKAWIAVALASIAIVLTGCPANTAHLEIARAIIEQQGKLDVERERTAQERARADTARAEAIKVGMNKNDMAATVGVAILGAADIARESAGGGRDFKSASVNPMTAMLADLAKPPESMLDKGVRLFRGVTGGVAELAFAASPFMLARENGKTQRYIADADVRREGVRQQGETDRISVVATRAPTTTSTSTTTITAGRDQANDRSALTNTQTECNANGGGGGTGSTGGTTGDQPANGGAAGGAANNC